MAEKFTSKTEYMATLRDRTRIESITSQVNVKDPKVAGELYKRLKDKPAYFETETGRRFMQSLLITYRSAVRPGGSVAPDEDDWRAKGSPAVKTGNFAINEGAADMAPGDRRRKTERPAGTAKSNDSVSRSASKKRGETARPAASKITIVEGPQNLRSRYNGRVEAHMEALDELTSGRREYNEFWDEPEETEETEDIAGKNKKRIKRLLILAGAVASIVLAVLLGKEISYRIENMRSKRKLAELQQIVTQHTETRNDDITKAHAATTDDRQPGEGEENDLTPAPTEAPAAPTLLPEYKELYSRNPDMVGWIRIPGTIVNYPVMQTADDMEYYLYRDFDRGDDKNGLPFADTRSDVFKPTANVLIYGHCMNSGAMFATLLEYKNRDFYEAHPVICFDTVYGRAEYEIIACFQSRVAFIDEKTFRYYNFIDTDSEEEFNEFIKNVKSMSYYDIPATAQFGDSLITLSTCDKEIQNGRMAVVARKITK
jgi:sortase B